MAITLNNTINAPLIEMTEGTCPIMTICTAYPKMISNALKKATNVGSISCNDLVMQKNPTMPPIEMKPKASQCDTGISTILELSSIVFSSVVKEMRTASNPPNPPHHKSTNDLTSAHQLILTLMIPSVNAATKATMAPM